MYTLLTALALGTSGCDRQYPLGAEARAPQAQQQARDSALAPSADTYIRQGNPNQNQGAEQVLRLQATGKQRALVRWDPQAVAGVIGPDSLVAARLELAITHNADNWGTTGRTIDLHRLTQAWTETGATWNCGDDANTANPVADCSGTTAWAMDGPDPRPYVATPTASRLITNGLGGVVTFDVTGDVRGLASGGGAQHGWILKKTDEGASGQVEFGARESASAPRLVLTLAQMDTSRPPIPQSLDYRQDTTRLVHQPGDTVVIFYRTLAFVYFDDSTSGSTVRAFLNKYQAAIVGGDTFAEGYIVQFPDPGPTWEAYAGVLKAMGQELGVETVAGLTHRDRFPGQDGRYPTDGPGFGRNAWFDSTSAFTWALKAVRAPLAWGCETGMYDAARVRLGVVEFTFDTALADLGPSSPRLFSAASAISQPPAPQQVRDIHERHASAVTSVLTAAGDNDTALAGMIWRSDLRLYALGSASILVPRNVVAAFVREILPTVAADAPRVLNISLLFGRNTIDESQVGQLRRALRSFLVRSPNTLIVKSAGNEDTIYTDPQEFIERQGEQVALHAALARLVREGFGSRILFVTGTEGGNQRWRGSRPREGATVVTGITEIAAPAENVAALGLRRAGEGVVLLNGTSLSGAFVAGAAAQLWGMAPNLTPGQVRDYIPARCPRAAPQLDDGPACATQPRDRYPWRLSARRLRLALPPVARTDGRPDLRPAGVGPGPCGAGGHQDRHPAGASRPESLGLTSVAQGGRLIATQVLGDTAFEVRILNHRGDSVATLAPDIIERHFLERDTADLVTGGVQLPNGLFVPQLEVHRHDGRDTTVQLFPNIPADVISMATLLAVSPAGDAAATASVYFTGPIQAPTEFLRWELVALPSGQVTTVLDTTAACGVDVPIPSSRPAWSHDGRRVVFPIIRVDVDLDCGTTDVRTQLTSFLGAQRTDLVVQDREILHPRFSPDDVVVHTFERILFNGCLATRRSPANLDPPLADSTADCGGLFQPPELLPNVQLRPGVVIAGADGARVRGSGRPRAGILPRRGGWAQAN